MTAMIVHQENRMAVWGLDKESWNKGQGMSAEIVSMLAASLGPQAPQLWDRVSETSDRAYLEILAERFNDNWAGDGYIASVISNVRGDGFEIEVDIAGYDSKWAADRAELDAISGEIHRAQDRFLERHI